MDALTRGFIVAGFKLAYYLHKHDKKRAVEEAVANERNREQPMPDPWQ